MIGGSWFSTLLLTSLHFGRSFLLVVSFDPGKSRRGASGYLLHTSIFSGFSDKCLQVLISRLVELDTLDQKMSYRVSYKAVACTTYLTGFNSQSCTPPNGYLQVRSSLVQYVPNPIRGLIPSGRRLDGLHSSLLWYQLGYRDRGKEPFMLA
ncbi:unnamed protein product [Nezara viridula]|uniref:Neuropeptide n=1 Tax=Nezara viridula TaxID=85310 RepID=A0A9P0MPI8_NEZVI|nr:unnamed protein product [Nezara viridula]